MYAGKQDWSLPLLTPQRESNWSRLHNRAITCARNLKAAYRELLEVLIEVEETKTYFQLEAPNLYQYCVDCLKLPKHTAYDFIDIVRTSKDVPALAQAIIDGKAMLTNARRVCSVITPENQDEWIKLVIHGTQKEIQKRVAQANPRAAVEESVKYVSGDVLEIKFAVSEEWAELLKETKDLLSTKEQRAVSTEEALFILMSDFKTKNCPLKKAERAMKRKQRISTDDLSPDQSGESHSPLASPADQRVRLEVVTASEGKTPIEVRQTRYIPADVRHAVSLRDQNQCVHRDRNGFRCSETRWLQIHHVHEFSNGGEHSLENLETLCAVHHRLRHESPLPSNQTAQADRDSV